MPRPTPRQTLPDAAQVLAHHRSLSPPDLYTFPFHVARTEEPWNTLKPFLDRWFKDGEIIAAVGVAAMHGFGEDRCTAACDGENGGFLYAGMAYHAAAAERAAGELAAEEAEATSKSKRRKRKPKGKGKKTDDATADLKPSSSASGVPPDDDDERDNSVHDGELSHSASIGIRTTRTPSTVPHPTSHQTCFCATCLNPPARYARLDDSDLDGEEEE